MKNLFFLVLLSFVLTGCSLLLPTPGADGIGDPYYPQLGNGGYDALYYAIELSVDPASNTVAATSNMVARATQPLSSFNLDFAGPEIERVMVDGQSAEYTRNERELTVTPVEPLPMGGEFTVVVTYAGEPPVLYPSVASGTFGTGWFQNRDGDIYVIAQPDGAAAWYPVNDHPLDKATYTFRITVPKPYVAATNGILLEEIDNGDTVTFISEMAVPMASYLAVLNIAEYRVETEEGPNGTLIRNYFPVDYEGSDQDGFSQTAELMDFFVERFGPYPFDVYGSVLVDFQDSSQQTIEAQTLAQHGPSGAMDVAVAHSLAHEWFGNSVSMTTWQDLWLKEGSTTYAEWLWGEQKYGPDVLDLRVRQIYAQEAVRKYAPGNPDPQNLYNDSVYNRGALTFHALRVLVGDETFFAILQTFTETYRHGNASTADFVAVAESVSGLALEEFFNGWLYQEEIPAIPEMDLSP